MSGGRAVSFAPRIRQGTLGNLCGLAIVDTALNVDVSRSVKYPFLELGTFCGMKLSVGKRMAKESRKRFRKRWPPNPTWANELATGIGLDKLEWYARETWDGMENEKRENQWDSGQWRALRGNLAVVHLDGCARERTLMAKMEPTVHFRRCPVVLAPPRQAAQTPPTNKALPSSTGQGTVRARQQQDGPLTIASWQWS